MPINQEPIITYTLRLLQKYGIQKVVINLHHQAEKIMAYLKSGSKWGLEITYSHEPEILGTGGGLKNVEEYFSNDTFLMINSDILVDIDLQKVVTFHKTTKSIATLVIREDPDAAQWGAIGIDSGNRVRQIRGRPTWSGELLGNKMFVGVHVIEPEIFEHLSPEPGSDIIEAYTKIIELGKPISGYTMKGYWVDIGTHERYRKAQDDFNIR